MPSDPRFDEMLAVLGSITAIEAGTDALDPEQPTFTVKLTFSRSWIRDYGFYEFAKAPRPTEFFQGVKDALKRLMEFEYREGVWAAEENKLGASIEDVINFLKNQKRGSDHLNGLADRLESSLYANAIDRLEQLKRRREAGGAAKTKREQQREADSKAWREEEINGGKRREEQRKQREKTSGQRDYTYSEFRDQGAQFKWKYGKSSYDDDFWENLGHYGNSSGSKPNPWFSVLGVSPSATAADIRKAARKLASQYHPDKHKDDPAMNRKMQEINNARDEGLAGLI